MPRSSKRSRASSRRRRACNPPKHSKLKPRPCSTSAFRNGTIAERSLAGSKIWSRRVTSSRVWPTKRRTTICPWRVPYSPRSAGIATAAAQLDEAIAAVAKAKADLKAAEAGVKVGKANLDMAKVFVEYTKILSPYDGVVIQRGESVHPGTFVRSASEGNGVPLFTVAEDDKMRTIVLVPDRDVPYCKVGDPATVQIDALSGKIFKATVSRIAASEDLKDRTMRVEIDLDNADLALRDGMFGRAEILLEKLIKNLSIPSSCLVQRNGRGEGAVVVVKNGELHRVPVRVGLDDALRVEVISGLNEGDEVVLRPDASVPDGTKVRAEAAKTTPEKTKSANDEA